MKAQVTKTIQNYNMMEKNDSLVCGVSGGADSMALIAFLLSIKKSYNLKIFVCHINHQLRGEESERDEKFVREFCKDNNIDFFVKRTDIKKGAEEHGLSIEQYGRDVRYNFFLQTAKKVKEKTESTGIKIATAHNLSDVTETMVFHIIRGTSIRGLRAIAPKDEKSLAPFVIIRPIIECNRFLITEYLKENNIKNMLDSSNLLNDYTRNKIRHEVLPVFSEINSNYLRNFFSLSRQAEEVNDFLSLEADRLLKKAEIKREKSEESNFLEIYNLDILKKSHTAVLSNAIMFFLERNNVNITKEKIKSVISLVNDGGKINLSKDLFLEVKENLLVLYNEDILSDKPYYLKAKIGKNKVKMNKTVDLKVINRTFFENFNINNLNISKNMLDYDIIKNKEIILRSRKAKDKVRIFGRGVTKSLKKLYNEKKIPKDNRNNLAILEVDNKIAWIEDFGVAEGYCVKENTEDILEINTQNF